jgi:hypothetical protein
LKLFFTSRGLLGWQHDAKEFDGAAAEAAKSLKVTPAVHKKEQEKRLAANNCRIRIQIAIKLNFYSRHQTVLVINSSRLVAGDMGI